MKPVLHRHPLERRECRRFRVPGMTVTFRKGGLLRWFGTKRVEDCPVIEMSKGGMRMFVDKKIKVGELIEMEFFIPDSEKTLVLKGNVKWFSPAPSKSYRYQVGVQFLPYRSGSGYNPPEMLKVIKELETEYINEVNPFLRESPRP